MAPEQITHQMQYQLTGGKTRSGTWGQENEGRSQNEKQN
jgi:hypothetical protein